MPLRKPASHMPKEDIAKEVLRFREIKHDHLSTKIGKLETKSIFFPFKIIEEIWKEIEYQKWERGKQMSGVRVYLANHLDDVPLIGKQMNIIFVLTELINGKNKDFFIELQDDWKNREDNPEVSQQPSLGPKSFNHGSPCPPDCKDDPEWP